MTGKPFVYTCDGNTAVLEVSSPEIRERGKRYEIEVAK
jgi:hypothetical protein